MAEHLALGWLAVSLVATAFAQVAFKRYFAARDRRWLAAAVVLFLVVPYSTYNALRGLPLSTVYVATAVSQLLVVGISLAWMRERYTRRQQAGFALVLAGVVLFNL